MIDDLKLPGETFSMWKFADDTTVSEVVPTSGESSLQEAVNHISSWSYNDLFQLNPTKCKELVLCFKKTPLSYCPIKIDGVEFERVSFAKVLGVTISNDLKWNDHVDTITSKAARRLYLLSQLKRAGISPDVITSVLEFSSQLFHRTLPKYLSDDIERIQRRAIRIIFPSLSYYEAMDKAGVPTLLERRESLSIIYIRFGSYSADVDLLYPPTHIHKEDSHNTGNFIPYSSRIVCGFFNVPQGTNEHGSYL